MRALLLVGLCGCDVLFQLDTVPLRDAAPDARADGLVAHYPMDSLGATLAGCMPDVAGGHDGNCVPQAPGSAAGVIDGAYVFDGNEGVRVAYDPAFDSASWTVTVWANLTANTGAYQCFINRIFGAADDDAWQICFGPGLVFAKVSESTAAPAVVIAPGSWHHFALTYDGTAQHWILWLDATDLAHADIAQESDATSPIVFGEDLSAGSPDAPFAGMLDDARFYNRALSPAEIATLATR